MGKIDLIIHEAMKKSYCLEDTIELYKSIHQNELNDYIDSVDYSIYSLGVNSYVKDPFDMAINICFAQLKGLLLAALEIIDESNTLYPLDLKQLIDTMTELSTLTLINYKNNPVPISLKCLLDPSITSNMLDKYRSASIIFDDELSSIVALLGSMVGIAYGSQVFLKFQDIVSEWASQIRSSFMAIVIIKSIQEGDQ